MPANEDPSFRLSFELTDVQDRDLNEYTLFEFFDTAGSRRYRSGSLVRRMAVVNVAGNRPLALYRVRITPRRHRPRQLFLAPTAGENPCRKLAFAVEPACVSGIEAPVFSQLNPSLRRLLSEGVYAALGWRQQACLLNIAAKAAATPLGGKSCLDHWERTLDIQQDRVFARTDTALEREAARSPLFVEATALLHASPACYQRTSSYKTKDAHGSLQLTFFRGLSAEDVIVDADIDEAQGLEHVFEVVRNAITGPTNPCDVREILIASQGIDPGYRFVFDSTAA